MIKAVISLEKINPFECYNAPSRAKSRTNDVTLKYHLCHFGTSQKGKNGHFINVIYKLIYLLLRIQGTCKSCKQTRACALVCLPSGNISCILNQRWINLYLISTSESKGISKVCKGRQFHLIDSLWEIGYFPL